jgi:hypothetical protein
MPRAGFELAIPVFERPKTVHVLDRAAIETGLREAEHRKMAELWPNDWILHHNNAPAHKALSVKRFLTQKFITEVKQPTYSPELAANDFWLFPKIKSVFKGTKIAGY